MDCDVEVGSPGMAYTLHVAVLHWIAIMVSTNNIMVYDTKHSSTAVMILIISLKHGNVWLRVRFEWE